MSDFSTEALQELGLSPLTQTAKLTGSSEQLGQSDFLKLMTVQLSNQDPLNPTENTDFIAQMAQFSTLTGIENLSESFKTLSQTLSQGQTLQAAALVGRDALIPAEFGELAQGGSISGAIDLASSASSVMVDVVDPAGANIRRLFLDDTSVGLQPFTWDGLREDGTPADPGIYEFRATVSGGSDESIASDTFLVKRIDSVAVGDDGALELSVPGMDSIGLADVRQIR